MNKATSSSEGSALNEEKPYAKTTFYTSNNIVKIAFKKYRMFKQDA